MSELPRSVAEYVEAVRASALTIYDPIELGSPLYIPARELETLLDEGLRGFSVAGLPLRTRSKAVKQRVCEVLGYPVPQSFKRCRPRFPGQNFDTYVQTANNLQVWNEQLTATRRYVLIRESGGVLTRVRVVTGDALAVLDTTGTLTQKYQARFATGSEKAELVTQTDTDRIRLLLTAKRSMKIQAPPTAYPEKGKLLTIAELFEQLGRLIGRSFVDAGVAQERNRGGQLHRLICSALGYNSYADDGRFPDVKHQLLEVKLQTAPTIDLGLVTPDSTEPLDIPKIAGTQVRHCDVRYALFDAATDGRKVTLRRLYLTTGQGFFSRFPRFGGKVLNKKLQIPLPPGFL